MSLRVIRWLIFNVALAVVPLVVSGLIRATRGQALSLYIMLANGELLLITVCMAGAAIGELLGIKERRYPKLELIAGGTCVVILVVTAIYFADISSAHTSSQQIDFAVIKWTSLVLYTSGFIASLSCIVIAEI